MIYKREEYLKKIGTKLAILKESLRTYIGQKWYDSNLISENFYAGLLNLVFEWNLVNLNGIHHVEPGIDLTDENEKIVVQVSSTNTSKKIQHTIEEYKKYNPDMQGYRLYMMFLLGRQKTYETEFVSDNVLAFDKDSNIIDNDSILTFLNTNSVSVDKLEKILKYLEQEIRTDNDSDISGKPYIKENFGENYDPVIGREEKLELIHQALMKQGEPGRSRRVFIRGIGGIGKSVLAKKYAEIYKAEYDIRIEVSADSFRRMISAISLYNWAGDGLDEEEKYNVKLGLLIEQMEQKKVLLIVHDYNTADDPEAAEWRRLPCDILATTWNEWKDIGTEIRLIEGDIEEKDAAAIFTHYYLAGSDPELQGRLCQFLENQPVAVGKLVKMVGYHPLSIKVLAKQMVCEEDDIITPEQMLRQLSFSDETFSDEKEFFHTHESGKDSRRDETTAHKHLEKVYIAALNTKKLTEEQLEALRYMTLTSPVCGISSARFSKWTGIKKRFLLQIEKRGWIESERDKKDCLDEESDKPGIYRMPMVISDILSAEKSLQSTIENSKKFIESTLEIDIDGCIGSEKRFALENQLTALTDHIRKDDDELLADLLNHTGYVLTKNSNFGGALKYQEKALEIRRNVLGEYHADTAQSYNDAGCTYGQMGNLRKSLEYQEKALEIYRKVLGDNHADTAQSYNNVGYTYEQMGDRQKGLVYKEKALEIYRRVLGDNHAHTALSYNNVGYTYERMGDLRKALEYLEKALEIRRNVLGDNHADTAQSYNNVGCTYERMGDLRKALEYLERALEIQRRVLGDNHADTAQSYNDVGCTYERMGDLRKGLKYKEKALEIRRRVLGDNHAHTAQSYNNVGYTYGLMGDLRKALEYQEKALEIWRRLLGDNHTDTATSYNNVGDTYERMGDLQKGLEYKEKALEIRRRVLGDNHAHTAQSYNNVGCIYEKMGDLQKGLEYKEKALEILINVLGDNHAHTAQSYNNVGCTYSQMGDLQKGLEYKEKALEIRRRVLGDNHVDTAQSYNNVGYTYGQMGDFRKALEYLEQALEIRRRVLGEDHADTALSYNNIGICYFFLSDYKKSYEYLDKAYHILKNFYGSEHPQTLQTKSYRDSVKSFLPTA